MEKTVKKYVHRRIVADASLKLSGSEERVIGRDAVMNIVGRYFVVYSGGNEIFRGLHKNIEAYYMQSGNGMEFIYRKENGEKETLRVHFIQDVKTPRWHNQTR